MKLLLDTHVFLWSLFSPDKLSETASEAIRSPENDATVSVITFWEISLKYALGKLELTGVQPEELPYYADQMNLDTIPITPAQACGFHNLPRITHKDPFDRMIIWQAIQQKMPLISRDRDFRHYQQFGLQTLW